MRRPGRTLSLRLWDILGAIEVARKALSDLSPAAFESALPRRFAVERAIEIISEASRHIPPDLKLKSEHLPWDQIASIGNILRHGYDSVDAEILWKIVTDELAPLETAVRQLLTEL